MAHLAGIAQATICRELGIKPDHCWRIEITMGMNDVAIMTIKAYMTEEQARAIGKDINRFKVVTG